MASPTHILVPSGKADADAIECNSIIFDQIETLRSGQIHLSQQLLSERTANAKVRQDLDLAEKAFIECSLKRNDSGLRLADSRVQVTKLQLDVVELQKALKEEESYVAQVSARIEELQSMTETATETLRMTSQRTAPFHLRLAGLSTAAPISRDTESMTAELARLKQENHKLKAQLSKLDVRLIEVAEEAQTEKEGLEVAVAEAKSRYALLKDQVCTAELSPNTQLKQLKVAIEVQLATNDELQAKIQAAELSLFGNVTASDAGAWPEL